MGEPTDYWRLMSCDHCDFSSGMRGMDWCGRCGGTGTQFAIRSTSERFPNTESGWRRMEARQAEIVAGLIAIEERSAHA